MLQTLGVRGLLRKTCVTRRIAFLVATVGRAAQARGTAGAKKDTSIAGGVLATHREVCGLLTERAV